MTAKIYRTDKVDQNPPITAHEHELLTPLSQTLLFSKWSAAVIDGSEKCNSWLNHELQSLRVIVIGPERPGKLMESKNGETSQAGFFYRSQVQVTVSMAYNHWRVSVH